MAQCDEIFQKIQQLNEKKAELQKAKALVDSVSEIKKKPDIFTVRGVDGTQLEIDFDQWWNRVTGDPENAGKWAERAVGDRSKPYGAEGLFENMDQLVRNIGDANAQELVTFLQKQTGDWEFYNERDFNIYTKKMDRQAFLELMRKNFKDANVDVDMDKFDIGVAENVGPFIGILNNQAKLQIAADMANVSLRKRIMELSEEIGRTGEASIPTKRLTMKTWASAIFAHRSLRIARRRWGQMGLNWQRVISENPALQDSVYKTSGRQATAEAAEAAEEVITATVDDLTTEGALITQINDAAN